MAYLVVRLAAGLPVHPTGGSRGGTLATYRNLMLTMLLGGLWHGASWNFVIWGGLHGLYLVFHKLAMGGGAPRERVRLLQLPSILRTNVAVLFAWIFFRASTLGSAWEMVRRIATFQPGDTATTDLLLVLVMTGATLTLHLWQPRRAASPHGPLPRIPASGLGVGAALGLVAVLVFSGGTPTPFIYFQF